MKSLLLVAACLVLPLVAVARSPNAFESRGIVTAWAVLSVFGFIFIARDKSLAQRGASRIPESMLHLVEMLGGWPGSYLAQQWFRHKTVKGSYRAVFWTIVLLHQLFAVAALSGWIMS